MKENSLTDGHRVRVAIDHNKNNNPNNQLIESIKGQQQSLIDPKSASHSSSSASSLASNTCSQSSSLSSQTVPNRSSNSNKNSCASTSSAANSTPNTTNPSATNFDDDYNEWELGIGDLIIDLDADIEKSGQQNGTVNNNSISGNNTKNLKTNISESISGLNNSIDKSATTCPSSTSTTTPTTTVMSSSKSSRIGITSGAITGTNVSSSSSVSNSSSLGSHHHRHHHNHHHQHHHNHPTTTSSANSSSSSSSLSSSSGSSQSTPTVISAVEHQATVEKGLKMKIKKMKNIGGKSSEAKHEIVSSDTSSAKYISSMDHIISGSSAVSSNSSSSCSASSSTSNQGLTVSNSDNNCSVISSSLSSSSSTTSDPKSSKHSNKGRSSSHRDKKDKSRDKDKNSSGSNSGSNSSSNKISTSLPSTKTTTATNQSVSSNEVNGAVVNSAPTNPSIKLTATQSSTHSSANSTSNINGSAPISRLPSTPTTNPLSSSTITSMPNITLKYSSPSLNPTVILRTDELTKNIPTPSKKIKLDKAEESISATRDTGTSTSIGTITEPDCLGPCEPGTSVTLEGIVWQETEGGVLVVNVTWRGKTYVGTLLDCTKHDWAPPRFCESPTSDIESKTNKNSRGKRSRSNMTAETTNESRTVQSKLRNGKGRRTANSGFTVPASPAKSDSSAPLSSKRKGRPSDLELSPINDNNNSTTNNGNNTKANKRNRSQTRNTPLSSTSSEPNTPLPQPSSPVLIECPEPNCSKKYKHINGLKYHQTHAHCNSEPNANSTDANVNKDGITSDNEDNNLDSLSLPSSPSNKITNEEFPNQINDNMSSNLSTLASVAINESNEINKSDSSSISADDNTDKANAIKFSGIPVSLQPFGNIATTSSTTTSTATSSSSLANSANAFLVSNHSSNIIEQNSSDQLNIKVDKSNIDANRVKSGAAGLTLSVRPLVPIPGISSGINSGMIAATSNLKPIQPKPTILGEPNTINPSLESLKKEKSKHKKKSKDKDRERDREKGKERKSSNGSSLSLPLNSSVVSDPKFIAKSLELNKNESEMSEVTPIASSSSDQSAAIDIYSSVDLVNTSSSSRALNVELSYKNANSPNGSLICTTAVSESDIAENKMSASEATIENVRSPAYSDISDANDTTTAIETNEIESIDKPEDTLVVDNPSVDISSQRSPNFLYPYFNQSQYLMSTGSSTSDSQRSTSSLQDNSKNSETDFSRAVSSKRPRVNSDTSDKNRSEDSTTNAKNTSPLPSSTSPEAVHEFASVTQSYPYAYSQSYSQGFMSRYPGYSIDPTYHMHLLATDPIYKEQCELYLDQERIFKEQQTESRDSNTSNKERHSSDNNKLLSPQINKNIDSASKQCSTKSIRPSSQPSNSSKGDTPFDSTHLSTNIKEKQSENRQILKENIELKSQMDAQNVKSRHSSQTAHPSLSSAPFDPLFERHREEQAKRYYMESLIEHKSKPEIDSHSGSGIGPPPLLKDGSNRSKSESTKSSTSSSSHKHSSPPSQSSPKGTANTLSLKESSKRDKPIEEKDDKTKIKLKEEGVKPTMETTGPPPPPTNGYYFNPSYLPTHHFSPMPPFDHSHPMFRAGAMSPGMMGIPFSGPAQYLHPQLRYPMGPMEMSGSPSMPPSSHPQTDPLVSKIHSNAPNPKSLDLLHHYGSHKIHELQERALISPTAATSGPLHLQPPSKSLTGSPIPVPTAKSIGSDTSALTSPGKEDSSSSDRRSPPPQRHLHTHHHTHVGVGYPIYDPYNAIIVSHNPTAAVSMHPFVPK